jgi:hypothetical protein
VVDDRDEIAELPEFHCCELGHSPVLIAGVINAKQQLLLYLWLCALRAD